MTEKNEKRDFVAYEYKEIVTDPEKASFLLDGYENFGWEQNEKLSELSAPGSKKIVLRLKRNRKIINKMELTRLQRNFEACVKEITAMEESKTSSATMAALIIGLIGTAFVAGSVFAVTAQTPYIILCIILAVPGFAGWITPYFIYKRIVQRKEEKLTPMIEAKYNEIYEICEKGQKLLY